ncbi:succinate dehydrogenase membrane anchor subunit [Diaporthe amygdali]|uniref:succinate dehydrogenase membrane anchor subunit n=1 Tax=Phomopsis amygdali TaxID=1214568 RepID=UPI0022FF1345|nr:succinate dehydrogenase membrane anchor subunit [Diaporthe amygdali]KAJ0108882.1 succinate dehydrogenase membrane anchor subunit [Diaporthe amygdali]
MTSSKLHPVWTDQTPPAISTSILPPSQHPANLATYNDCDAPTSPKKHGISCSSSSAAADRCRLTIHGTFDPGWPVDALQNLVEAKHPALVEAQHQVIHGSVNEPAPVPSPSPSHGHYHWTFERGMAAALVPLSIAPFAAGSLNPTMDALLATTLLVHAHMGVQAIIIDYVPKKRYPNLRKSSHWLLNAATILAGIGLYEFETTDVGLVEATKRLWRA